MKKWIGVVCLAVLALAACKLPAPSQDIDAADRAVFDAIRHHDEAALGKWLAPELNTPEMRAKLAEVQALIPAAEPKGRKLVGWRVVTGTGGNMAEASDEYDYGPQGKALVQVRLVQDASKQWKAESFNFRIATAKDLEANKLSITGKSPLQYGFLLAWFLSLPVMIVALVKVIRTQGLKRKWLWGILAFAGLFSFRMDWATGEATANWFTVQVIGWGLMKNASAFAIWAFNFTLPVGAILILAGVWANPARSKAGRKAAKDQVDAFTDPDLPPPTA